ncbi:hypothetical protein Hanom_Chr07g00580661 [Helianthus anomalus]
MCSIQSKKCMFLTHVLCISRQQNVKRCTNDKNNFPKAMMVPFPVNKKSFTQALI